MDNYHEVKGGWYIAPMGRLEWLETILKLAAMGVAFATLAFHFRPGLLATPSGDAGTQSRILFWMAVGLAFAIVDRLQQRELFSIAFVVVNDLAHWAMYLSLMSGLNLAAPVVAYCALMMGGDVAKIVFFATSKYTVRGIPKPALLAGVGAFVIAYGVVLVLAL
ncbi:MAG: hypothetical protein JXA58_08125 [Dehalococcoidia bacterium]|nr:hypothetical protein [Dehalococcoidia bacterium]